ncbi:MAG: OsmC family protein [Thermoplasmata archaeon]|nr:OsmC family protein [Thermoplasmata archaeon]
MQASAVWEHGFTTELSDGRGHRVTVDLPIEEDGADLGPSALDLSVMSLAGCIVTILLLVARRRRLPIEGIRVHLEADRPAGAPTVASVDGTVSVRSTGEREEVETAVRLTVRSCPVGVLFERAGIPLRLRVVVERPTLTERAGGAGSSEETAVPKGPSFPVRLDQTT